MRRIFSGKTTPKLRSTVVFHEALLSRGVDIYITYRAVFENEFQCWYNRHNTPHILLTALISQHGRQNPNARADGGKRCASKRPLLL